MASSLYKFDYWNLFVLLAITSNEVYSKPTSSTPDRPTTSTGASIMPVTGRCGYPGGPYETCDPRTQFCDQAVKRCGSCELKCGSIGDDDTRRRECERECAVYMDNKKASEKHPIQDPEHVIGGPLVASSKLIIINVNVLWILVALVIVILLILVYNSALQTIEFYKKHKAKAESKGDTIHRQRCESENEETSPMVVDNRTNMNIRITRQDESRGNRLQDSYCAAANNGAHHTVEILDLKGENDKRKYSAPSSGENNPFEEEAGVSGNALGANLKMKRQTSCCCSGEGSEIDIQSKLCDI